ncbi:polypyrimidine tract-binding protein homolog 3 [Tanacetum coccineum]
MLYPITVEVLHQVFYPNGYFEKVVIFQKSAHVQALIQFQSRYNAIAARNSLQGLNIYEGCCQLDIQFLNLEELQPNQDENICYYYWENCFSILNADKADNTKPPLSANTCGNNGGHDSETSSPVTPTEEVVDSGHSSTLPSLVEHGSPGIYNFVQLNAGERNGVTCLQNLGTCPPVTRGSEDSPEDSLRRELDVELFILPGKGTLKQHTRERGRRGEKKKKKEGERKERERGKNKGKRERGGEEKGF